MKKLYPLLGGLLVVSLPFMATAQDTRIIQATNGAGYSQQSFVDLSTGSVETIDEDAWDLAFPVGADLSAGVFINEGNTYGEPSLQVYLANTTDWNETIVDSTDYDFANPLLNPEQNWQVGALNTVADTSNALDFGWGSYDTNDHIVKGSRIFVVQQRDGSFKKLRIDQLKLGDYAIRYANLDGTNEVLDTIKDTNVGAADLAYYSLRDQKTVVINNDYDLIFSRYSTPLAYGDSYLDYTVTGVLLAPGTQAAEYDSVDVETFMPDDLSDAFSSMPTAIGHNWKKYSFSGGYVIDQDRVYFVRTRDDHTYKVVFEDFEGSSTGITTMSVTEIETVGVETLLAANIGIDVFPNPVTDVVNVRVNGAEQLSNLSLYSLTGQRVLQSEDATLDVSHLPNGVYNLLISYGASQAVSKLLIQH